MNKKNKGFTFIGLVILIGSLCFALLIIAVEYHREYGDCKSFSSATTQYLPVRCLQYFLDTNPSQTDLGFAGPVSVNTPSPFRTPGVTNPSITQETMSQTICNKAWSTKSIRPSVSYTNKLKLSQIKEYGYTDTNPADYEEDHLISLELGGSPTDPKNLWPEAYLPIPGAHEKDSVENYLHKQVCNGSMTLIEAQHEISTNWLTVYVSILHK